MVIKYLLNTEKSIRLMQDNNVITAIVEDNANKNQIKEFVEKEWNVKVEKVRITNVKGKKKAYIKINKEEKAVNIANKYGII
jgi:ribosomal protein L23